MDQQRLSEISKIIEKFCDLEIFGPNSRKGDLEVYYKGKRHYKADLRIKLKGKVDPGFMDQSIYYSTWFCDNHKIKLFDFHPFVGDFSINYYFGFTEDELHNWAKMMLKNYISDHINCEDESYN